jgi:hypothetical protein
MKPGRASRHSPQHPPNPVPDPLIASQGDTA